MGGFALRTDAETFERFFAFAQRGGKRVCLKGGDGKVELDLVSDMSRTMLCAYRRVDDAVVDVTFPSAAAKDVWESFQASR